MGMIACTFIDLGKAAIGVLHTEQEVDALNSRSRILAVVGFFEFRRQSSDFRVCSLIVNGGLGPIAASDRIILLPAAVGLLVFDNVGNAGCGAGSIRRIYGPCGMENNCRYRQSHRKGYSNGKSAFFQIEHVHLIDSPLFV
ncbi:hypothetical protein D3C81_1794120 [compost metagenome]